MSSEDFELPFQKKIVAAVDFVDFVTQGARATTTTSDTSVSNTTISHLTTTLTGDLAPHNYLIDSTGQVQAVLDWDGALYLPVGSNLRFMTLNGGKDTDDRQ
ncbi:uncharacterized protein N7529_001405 [Penicillium soppii]|uniref:uncharacterized protein n=1 Tax=Penicillium soppii TaxID=69789 RepID=UPI0025486A7B|nr:uncharacterized protein N7529_001405 [Penicillium soppii]KAJ5875821.1 hypothetical protein N7529_001405 [Penicillium soppii]